MVATGILRVLLMLSLLSLAPMFGMIPATVHAQTTGSVNVTSVDQSGNPISGYYVALYDSGGNLFSSGFTAVTFYPVAGDQYSLQADSYGSCTFNHWSDGATGDPMTFTAAPASAGQSFTAVYQCGTVGGQSSITVNSQDENGNVISGYYTALYSSGSSNSAAASGFTPVTFSTTPGQTYSVQVDNYGNCNFDRWSDGVASNPRTFTAGDPSVVFTAVYDCGGTVGSGQSTISVSTVGSGGNTLTGYYITLWQDGAQLQSCFSTCSFTVNNGETYQVGAASYGAETFSHWQNDGATGLETVKVPGTTSTISLTAVYTSATVTPSCTTPISSAPMSFELHTGINSPAYLCVRYYYYNSTSPMTFTPVNTIDITGWQQNAGGSGDTYAATSKFTITANVSSMTLGGPSNLDEGVTVMYTITGNTGSDGTYGLNLGWLAPSVELCGPDYLMTSGTGQPSTYVVGDCITLTGSHNPLPAGNLFAEPVSLTNSTSF